MATEAGAFPRIQMDQVLLAGLCLSPVAQMMSILPSSFSCLVLHSLIPPPHRKPYVGYLFRDESYPGSFP